MSKMTYERWRKNLKGLLDNPLTRLEALKNNPPVEDHPSKGMKYLGCLEAIWFVYYNALQSSMTNKAWYPEVKAEYSEWCHKILAVSNEEFSPEAINCYRLRATRHLILLSERWGTTVEDYKLGISYCEQAAQYKPRASYTDYQMKIVAKYDENEISNLKTSLEKKISDISPQNLNDIQDNTVEKIKPDESPAPLKSDILQQPNQVSITSTLEKGKIENNLSEQVNPSFKGTISKQDLKKKADAGSMESALAFAKILCHEDKDYDQALEYFDKVIGAPASQVDKGLKVDALINVGKIHYHHKAKPIIECFQEAYKADPSNTECRINLAKILCYHQGKYLESIEHFKYCLERSPKDYDALLGLAKAYLGHGMSPTDSLKALDNLLAIYPDDTEGLLQRGKILAYHVNTPEAKDQAHECFTRLYTLDPKNAEGRINLAKTLCYHKKKCTDSIKHFEYYLERNPGNYEALLGIVKGRLASSNNYEQSLKAIDNLLAEYPNDIEGLLQRGKLLTYFMNTLERHEEIRCCLEKLLGLDPNNSEASFVLGLFYMDKGCNNRALDLFKASIKAAPSTGTHMYIAQAKHHIKCIEKPLAMNMDKSLDFPPPDMAMKPLGLLEPHIDPIG